LLEGSRTVVAGRALSNYLGIFDLEAPWPTEGVLCNGRDRLDEVAANSRGEATTNVVALGSVAARSAMCQK